MTEEPAILVTECPECYGDDPSCEMCAGSGTVVWEIDP